MSKAIQPKDPDIAGALPALRRAAKAAHQLAKQTGTPLYVFEDGKIVDLNPVGRKRSRKRPRK